jgi:hypothetical protein
LASALALGAGAPLTAQVFGNAGDCATSRAQASIDKVGRAMIRWLTDVVSGLAPLSALGGSACVGSEPVDTTLVPEISVADLRALLVPQYIDSIPAADPWGTPFDYRLNVAEPLSAHAIALRSAGADRTFEGTSYATGATSGAAGDLVHYNGFAVRAPPRLDAVSRQTQTAAQLVNLGTAMLSWFTDIVSAAQLTPVGGPTVDLSLITPTSAADLAAFLSPFYIQCVPELDGWGRPLDLRLNDDLLGFPVMSIRSAGSDGILEGQIYDTEVFPADDFARDLVWSDGLTYRGPSSTRTQIFTDDFESARLWGTWSCGPGF